MGLLLLFEQAVGWRRQSSGPRSFTVANVMHKILVMRRLREYGLEEL